MPPTLRWLSLLVVLLVSTRAAAHPLLEDALTVTLAANSVTLEVRSTLRPVVVAAGAVPQSGSYFKPSEMDALVQAHSAYLTRHLSLRANDQLLAARETHAERVEPAADPIQAHIDLERFHAHFSLVYPLDTAPTRLSLEQDMLSDAPGDRSWRVTYVVSVRNAGDSALLASGLLTPERGFDVSLGATSTANAEGAENAAPRNFIGYFLAGVRHILSGWDHLLFVSALVLATRRLIELVKVVLAFTVAHSLTLTLAVLHVVYLPAAIVEPLIALSIIVVSLENLLRPARGASMARLTVAFGFGLVHGLGFAGPLVEALRGAPREVIALGIVGFSFGVELGHQLVVLPLFALTQGLAGAAGTRAHSTTLRVGSLLTALGGAFFLLRALQTFVLA